MLGIQLMLLSITAVDLSI